MNAYAEKIRDFLSSYYTPEEWPTLLWQAEEWSQSRPLEGLRVLDGTPLFRNTLGKFMALLAAVSGLICAFLSKALGNRRRCFIRFTALYSVIALGILTACTLLNIQSPWLLGLVLFFGVTGNINDFWP